MLNRLYLRIYLTLLGAVLVCALVIGIGWRYTFEGRFMRTEFATLATEVVNELLPAQNASHEALQGALERWRKRMHAELTLYDANRAVLVQTGPAPTMLPAHLTESGWLHPPHGPPAIALHLPDGRWLVARHEHPGRRFSMGFILTLVLIALSLGVVAYPVSRRLTRRLEALRTMAESLAAGKLSARAPDKGKDEVASLARSFNRSAERIETLVNSQRNLLANASHELRSPLTRVRMALESLGDGAASAQRASIESDIAELDQLIDEILLASRLETAPALKNFEEVDVAGLAAEECARLGANVEINLEVEPVSMHGDPLLLRRLLRNLLENAQRHGAGSFIEVSLRNLPDANLELRVCDRGPGVPESEREKIFQPFYRLQGSSERHGGVGLGLALVRQIAQHHNGDVRCEPRSGGGSCFVVVFRLASPD